MTQNIRVLPLKGINARAFWLMDNYGITKEEVRSEFTAQIKAGIQISVEDQQLILAYYKILDLITLDDLLSRPEGTTKQFFYLYWSVYSYDAPDLEKEVEEVFRNFGYQGRSYLM